MDSAKNYILDTSWSRLKTALNNEDSYIDSRPRTTHSVRKNVKSSKFPTSFNIFRSPSASRNTDNKIKLPASANPSARNSRAIPGLSLEQIKIIYAAKCEDLEIPVLFDQEKRFINFCIQHFSNRKFNMKESGIGKITAKVIGDIIQGNENFAFIELGKNLLKDSGAIKLVKRIMKSTSIVHLDLSSNEISVEGSEIILKLLGNHTSLSSLDISSHEGLHRNRLALLGSQAVGRLLTTSPVLSILNIAGTGIGPDGIEYIITGLNNNHILSSLNLSNNNLGWKCIEKLAYTIVGTDLKELSLASNKLENEGCESLSLMLSGGYKGYCTVIKLDISQNDITTSGLSKLFAALRINSQVKQLDLKKNDFSRGLSTNLLQFLEENFTLEWLDMSHCSIDDNGLDGIKEGLIKNLALKSLLLNNNHIKDEGTELISFGLSKNKGLKKLDLSNNKIRDKGGLSLAKAINSNDFLEELYLKNNSLKDSTGQAFSEFTRYKHNILKLCLEINPMNFKYLEIIQNNMKSNHEYKQQMLIPKLQKMIDKIAFKDSLIEELYEMIAQKEKEKFDLERKLKSKIAQFEELKSLENKKFEEIKKDYVSLREISLKLSSEIDDLYSQIKVSCI